MKTKTIWVVVSVLVVLGLLVEGFYSKALIAAEKKPVKIGLIVYTTGVAKSFGDHCLRGLQLAIKQINDKGGILDGRMVEYKVYDEGYSPEVAIASVKRAIADGCKGIVGLYDATTAVPGMLVAKDAGIPLVVAGAGTPRITQEGYRGLLHVVAKPPPAPGNYMESTATWLEAKGYKRIIQLGPESQVTHNIDAAFKKCWDRPGSPIEFLGTLYFPYGAAEATLEVTKAVAKKPDMIYSTVWGNDLVLAVLDRVHELGYKGDHMIAYMCLLQSNVDETPKAAEGTYCSWQWIYDPTVPASVEYRKAYLKMHGVEPEAWGEMGYEGVMAMLMAMNKAGTDSDLKKIGDAMHDPDYWLTPRGEKLEVFPDGQFLIKSWAVTRVVDGKMVVVGQMPLVTTELGAKPAK